jgi:hypothetical protein
MRRRRPEQKERTKIQILADKNLFIYGIKDLKELTDFLNDNNQDLNDNTQEITYVKFDQTELVNLPDLSSIFPYLKELIITDNKNLTVLPDLSNLLYLEILTITDNKNLTTVLPDLSGLPRLYDLHWSFNGSNDFSMLSKLTHLNYFNCDNNNLTELPNLSGCTYLRSLTCSNNELTELSNLSGLKHLDRLYCENNQLTELSISQKLLALNCSNNKLTELPDLSQFDNFRILLCANNPLTKLPALPNSTKDITISIDQIGLLINDDNTPTDALNTLNDNSIIKPVYITIYDIDVKRFIKEPPPKNENENNFYYDKILNDETYKYLITKYHIKYDKLIQFIQNKAFILDNRNYKLTKFQNYVRSIENSVKFEKSLEAFNVKDKKEKVKLDALNQSLLNSFLGGKKSKKTKKSKKSKKSKKNIKRRKSVKL